MTFKQTIGCGFTLKLVRDNKNNIQLSVFVCFFIHRQPRHHKWRMNYADNDNHDQFTTTQATTVTTTKSPEQIIKEKEAIIYSVTLKE